MRLYVAPRPGGKGKYDDAARLTYRTLPSRPAAVCIFNNDGRTGVLVFDFDPKATDDSPAARAAARAAVERDAFRLIAWVRELGGTYVADVSPRGGIHVYVPLARGEQLRCRSLLPMYQQLQSLLPTLDILPMSNPEQGCIAPPGARCKGGGFRELLGMTVSEALAAFETRSAPGLAAKLRGIANEQMHLTTAQPADNTDGPAAGARDYVPGPGADDRLPTVPGDKLRPWVAAFLRFAKVPDLRDKLRKPWTPSHARLSVLHQLAMLGWSLNDVRATRDNPDWAGFWAHYAQRKDHVKRLTLDWTRAFEYATKRLASKSENSSKAAHKSEQVHTGGDRRLREIRYTLAAARKWILISGHFQRQQQWTALVVVTALAAAMAMNRSASTAVGIRFLSVAAGLCGEEATHTVLRKLRSIEGSPVCFVSRWNARDHSGDRYSLITPRLDGEIVRAAEWEAIAARPEPIDPIWSEVGFAAWWVYTMLQAIESGSGETVAPEELAAAARISLSTVHRAIRRLQEFGLVDYGHGWIARTGRSPRRVPDLTARADERHAARLARHRDERAEFWEFWDVITANYDAREISGYSSIAELDHHTPDYLATVSPGARPPTISTDQHEPDEDDDEAALALLQLELGATILEDALCP
ncbi:hypothetical protein [Nocardia yamanashiensis]|uniref:hypothetical protein n=1 Tax=Nocardia yamanashiensis TaxID=209247 RepID=UPI000834FF08|nr:hypothetical protein [Nocardia yamanashiensis]